MTSLIQTHDINVTRQGKNILHNININIGLKDFITVIGPNGAGKSMLLKCLMGFYIPDNGTVVRKNNLKVGYIPQHLLTNHIMPITVKRFLLLRQKIDKLSLQQIIDETGIEHILKKPLSVLSGGELQRVLLARGLLNNPELLIMDEPAQNLDISGQLHFYKLIENLYTKRNLSILMVSHDLHMVMASTKQVICLFHHICCSGEPQIVTKTPEFISLFGNDMANMMAIYQHTHTHTHHEHHHD